MFENPFQCQQESKIIQRENANVILISKNRDASELNNYGQFPSMSN